MGQQAGSRQAAGRLDDELERLSRYPLLIVDELGYMRRCSAESQSAEGVPSFNRRFLSRCWPALTGLTRGVVDSDPAPVAVGHAVLGLPVPGSADRLLGRNGTSKQANGHLLKEHLGPVQPPQQCSTIKALSRTPRVPLLGGFAVLAPTLVEREHTIDRFALHLVPQPYWRFPHALWFWAMGLGAGTFMVRHVFSLRDTGTIAGLPLLDVLGLILVGIGGLVLILDLGRPERVLLALKRPDRSWIARGAIADFVFLIVGAIYVLPGWFPGLPWTDAPFLEAQPVAQVMIAICFLAAALIIGYPGMVLYESLSIRLWHSALVPTQFIAHAIATSIGLTLVVLIAGDRLGDNLVPLGAGFLVALVGTLGLTHIYLIDRMHEHGPAARAGVRRLVRGPMAAHFWTSVVVGFGAPVVLTLVALAFPDSAGPLLVVGGLLSIFGSLQFRYAQLRAGIKVSPVG